MKRILDAHLLKWKDGPRRKPLVIRGARQVGKTYSVMNFGKTQFESIALVNLERNPEWHRLFEGNLAAARICADLEIVLGQRIVPGKTLLFIDEIQACPTAVNALRYLYEEMPDLHVIAAGSLIEFAMRDLAFPVGRLQFLHLRPLCFAEYLMATGAHEAAAVILGPPGAVSETVHAFLCDQLRRYFFIGGMPESVKAFVETGSMQEAFAVQAEICETYRLDFAKYKPRTDHRCLNGVLGAIARGVGQQIKYARLADGYANLTLKKAFELLCLANVVFKVPAADPSGLPLGAGASSKIFKAVMADIGLMRYLAGMPVDVEYAKADLLGVYRGAMAEQFVGQELALSQDQGLYYWSRGAKSSTAEVDYLAVADDQIHPIEVKSGATGTLKSLHLFLKTYPNCPDGMVLSMRPYAVLSDQKIRFIPLYFAFSAGGGRFLL